MKTFDKKDVFTCANEENASSYIMKQGYFADDIKELREAIVSKPLSHLIGIELDATYPFASNLGEKGTYRLFIPADKVKEVEETKKYRPFNNIEEFLNQYKVGQVVYLRNKKNNIEQLTLIVAVFLRCYCCVCLGLNASALPLKELFEEYEIKINEKWQPFGVEE